MRLGPKNHSPVTLTGTPNYLTLSNQEITLETVDISDDTNLAVTSPIIEAKEEETSYAIGTIALWGLIALIFYPKVGQLLSVTDINFGIFAGTAIHSTPQVVGAGFMYSDLAGKTATAVKLVRNIFIVPVAFLLAFLHSRKRNNAVKNNR